MKKKYETPYLIAESFQLNAAVAGSCGQYSINHNENNCGFGAGQDGYTWQFFNTSNCTVDLVGFSGGDNNDTICYHGPYDAGVTFTLS